MDTQELQFVRGGVAVACLDNLWDYVKKAFNFIMEYQEDFVRGFKKGWNSL